MVFIEYYTPNIPELISIINFISHYNLQQLSYATKTPRHKKLRVFVAILEIHNINLHKIVDSTQKSSYKIEVAFHYGNTWISMESDMLRYDTRRNSVFIRGKPLQPEYKIFME